MQPLVTLAIAVCLCCTFGRKSGVHTGQGLCGMHTVASMLEHALSDWQLMEITCCVPACSGQSNYER
jgi:hypothetical protein